ncbi:MAG: S8 family serine peptidase, partial [Fimbriimonadaceae bacterium]
TVDIGAPGSGIWSTVPGTGNTSAYASYNGTSMASPHITGVLALLAAAEPGLNGLRLKDRLLRRGIPTTTLAGITLTGDRANGFIR